MFDGFAYAGVSEAMYQWAWDMRAILLLLAALGLALALTGLALRLLGSRGSSSDSGPSGLSKR